MMNKDQGKTRRVKGFFTKRKVSALACITLLCFSVGYFWNTSNGAWLDTPTKASNTMSNHIQEDLQQIELPRMIYTKPQILKPPRSDVLMMTPWFAPVVWEGTYNSEILNEQFRQRNVTVGLTVFAIKNLIWPPVKCSNFSTLYINETQQIRIGSTEYQIHFENIEPIWEDGMKELKFDFVQDTGYVVFLKKFLETAETYFMIGHRVNYYIFTDRPEDVPKVVLKDGRNVVVLQVQNYPRWQEISMRRMEMINYFSQQQFINEVSYLVCVDVDMRFNDEVGVEILSNLFGTLHPGFYAAERQSFTYERRPASQAYIPRDEGDFYYAGSFFGGTVMEVYKLTKKCHEAIMVDKANGIEAIWQEESHLNKYFVYHKPTKILSPEYFWDDNMGRPAILKKRRFLAVPKNHAAIRNK